MRRLYGTPLPGNSTTDFADTAPSESSIATAFLDSVRLPPAPPDAEDERIVRPSLAILFRMAVGPGADYYAPRFLEYERLGRSGPGWNWAALLAPAVWAIYRRLWWPALAFGAWPLLALAALWWQTPQLADAGTTTLTAAAIFAWLIPGVTAALIANALVYRKARSLVLYAEARTTRTDKAAHWLSRCDVIAPVPAAVAVAAMLVTIGAAAPRLESAYADEVVRLRVAQSLAAVAPLQRQLESWFQSRLPSDAPPSDVVEVRPGALALAAVNVSPDNGRVRLALGSIPELAGRSILLAPAIDRRLHVQWICIPVDIPEKYLPQECRQG
jgi:hypothetical protein